MASTTNGGASHQAQGHQGIANPYSTPLEPSFLNMEPQDEFIREIADWIAFVSGGRPDIEIEAKFGVVLDKGSGSRTVKRLGILIETILDPRDASGIRFESKLLPKQHEHLNRMLNDRVALTASTSYAHAPLTARHLVTTDEFFAAPSAHSHESGEGKLRVSRDDKTGQLMECIIKRRLGDLHILCPKREVDWRISVNVEEKADVGLVGGGAKPLYSRRKDRMEYLHQHFHVDLTQVTDNAGIKNHELELEFAFPDEVRQLLELRGREGPEIWGYDQLMAVFVNNCRILSRNIIRAS